MKIKTCYKNSIINLPAETVLPKLSTASREELAVLISVCAESTFDITDLASRLNITENSLLSALSKWTRVGVLSITESSKTEAEKAKNANITSFEPSNTAARAEISSSATTESVQNSDNVSVVLGTRPLLTRYTSADVADYLESNPTASQIIDQCQSIFGKLFSPSEIATTVSMIDQLALEPTYVLLMFAYCAKLEKKNVKYAERLTMEFYDNGIMTYDQLSSELERREKAASTEGIIRKLFGIGERAFSKNEKEMIYLWTNTYAYGEDILTHAYQITVDKTGSASFPYANKVLQNWYNAGYRSMNDITDAENKYKADKEKANSDGGSFSTDEFFELALRRSYSEQ